MLDPLKERCNLEDFLVISLIGLVFLISLNILIISSLSWNLCLFSGIAWAASEQFDVFFYKCEIFKTLRFCLEWLE